MYNVPAPGALSNVRIVVLAIIIDLICAFVLTGCSSSPQTMFARHAAAAGVSATPVAGVNFTHLIYRRTQTKGAASTDLHADSNEFTLVFIEGDSAWIDDQPVYVYDRNTHSGGIVYTKRPVDDPTPRHPLAFNLMLKTTLPAWYITRPCYNGQHDVACNQRIWTFERYSLQVVDSMAMAIARFAATQHAQRLVLVGYSGGGTLAVLLAPRLPQVTAVISIAANLDTQAWSDAMHFDPLQGSLNPAVDLASLSIPHIALVGDQDRQVPFSTVSRFLAAQPNTQVMHYADYDHLCCWEKNWPALLDAALAQIPMTNIRGE